MSLDIPNLSIESLLRVRPEGSRPLVLAAHERGRDIVKAVCPRAVEGGIRSGDTVTAARALLAELEVRPHEPKRDRMALEHLATALLCYTPDVCLDGEHGLLLEIGRTATLFGGEGRLAGRVLALTAKLGYEATGAVAPHPAAARVLARAAGRRVIFVAADELEARLATLPWSVARPSSDIAQILRSLGLETLGKVLALPRASVGARFGRAFAEELARIAGEKAEIPERHRPTKIFTDEVEWWPPTSDATPLVFAAKRLLDAACEVLLARRSAIARATCTLFGAGSSAGDPVVISLRPSRPTTAVTPLLRLLQHRLEVLSLRAPISRLRIAFDETVPVTEEQGRLFAGDDGEIGESAHWLDDPKAAELCDRLRCRLGDDHLVTPELVADHRPEYATGWRRIGETSDELMAAPPAGRRPFELDFPPLRLDVQCDGDMVPRSILSGPGRGIVRVVSGPERIEGGWWDGEDVRRRYFEIETEDGAHLWIFQDLIRGSWYRHGVFS